MKHQALTQLIALFLLVLVIALAGGCSTLYKTDQAADRLEDQVETALEGQVDPDRPQDAAALTQAEAEEIALSHAGFTADQVTGLHSEFDVDDGVPEYEVEFFRDGWEYDYTIHADTGDILDQDIDDN